LYNARYKNLDIGPNVSRLVVDKISYDKIGILLADEDNLDNAEVSDELSTWYNLGKYYSNLYYSPITNYYSTLR